jgi:hypothetical protein
MYPGENLEQITVEKLIDLYLQTFTQPGDFERGPAGYGYDTDYFFGFTARDLNMKSETADWLAGFYWQLDPCSVQSLIVGYTPPDEVLILRFLQTGVYQP